LDISNARILEIMGINLINIPNLLSGFRLIAAPFLLYLAWTGHPRLFLTLLAVSLFSDAIDGFIARRLNETSEFGTKLDSWGDLATYLTVPLGAWWLWPEILKREAFFVVLAVSAYVFPLIAGFVKFRRLPSYHTWAAKVGAVLMSIAFFILFIFDISWPFHCAAILQALVACEEIAITLLLPEWHGNVPSFLHAMRLARTHSMETNNAE
jgi:CDP-diacylglycerol--glycerol-3-phosphate 3-phosphatidyltransferase